VSADIAASLKTSGILSVGHALLLYPFEGHSSSPPFLNPPKAGNPSDKNSKNRWRGKGVKVVRLRKEGEGKVMVISQFLPVPKCNEIFTCQPVIFMF
jgi:hypothetical protein